MKTYGETCPLRMQALLSGASLLKTDSNPVCLLDILPSDHPLPLPL